MLLIIFRKKCSTTNRRLTCPTSFCSSAAKRCLPQKGGGVVQRKFQSWYRPKSSGLHFSAKTSTSSLTSTPKATLSRYSTTSTTSSRRGIGRELGTIMLAFLSLYTQNGTSRLLLHFRASRK